jgi:hypothetical protein
MGSWWRKWSFWRVLKERVREWSVWPLGQSRVLLQLMG